MYQNDILKVKIMEKWWKNDDDDDDKWQWRWRISSLKMIDDDDDDAKHHLNSDDVQMTIWPLSLMTQPLGFHSLAAKYISYNTSSQIL